MTSKTLEKKTPSPNDDPTGASVAAGVLPTGAVPIAIFASVTGMSEKSMV